MEVFLSLLYNALIPAEPFEIRQEGTPPIAQYNFRRNSDQI